MKKLRTVQPDMNVTPLVDVVLVLLIIFMVVAPRMDQDVQVELPGILNPDPDVESQIEPLKLSMSHAGDIYVDQQKYDLDQAIEVLSAEHAIEPHRRLVLRADKGLTYGKVRPVLARTQQVGFPGMSLMVGERHRPGAAENADDHDPNAQPQLPATAANATGGEDASARKEG
jgi:biopolymer transport protein ExbD/biopolymer transport protein TolR